MTEVEREENEKLAKAMIKATFMDGAAEINGRTYTFLKMVHKDRRRVFAFMSKIGGQLSNKDLSFLDSVEFEPVEKVIMSSVSFNDSILANIGDEHWDKYAEDYVMFISTAMQVISYPFFAANATG